MARKRQLYYDALFNGLVPVHQVTRDAEGRHQVAATVQKTTGAYKEGETIWFHQRYLVIKLGIRGFHQWVREVGHTIPKEVQA